jgi:hypothetical protein
VTNAQKAGLPDDVFVVTSGVGKIGLFHRAALQHHHVHSTSRWSGLTLHQFELFLRRITHLPKAVVAKAIPGLLPEDERRAKNRAARPAADATPS